MNIYEKKEETVDEPPKGLVIDGSFACMTCEEIVDEAVLLPVERIVAWECSLGHKSAIENFNLGA
jgi:hypothetical protein